MTESAEYLSMEVGAVRASGLFLADWYLERHPEAADGLAAGGLDALEYYCRQGWRQGDQPNPYFDPAFYLVTNPDVARAGVNPLLHYVLHGDQEGRNPCRYFDVKWYRAQYHVGLKEISLKHFLDRRFTGEVAPVPIFDPVYYFETNPDVAMAGSDPFEHFLAYGELEGRNPSADFDMKFYAARYGAVLNGLNPLLHYLANRATGLFSPARPEHEKLIPGAVKRATRPSPHFEEFRPVPPGAERAAKVLAYYLPQFHRIPENDAWWGKGFTDWTNLARALPRFAGHLQPRVPRDLGFYDLNEPETLRRQIELAAGAGLFGFVFYFYWFNGRRLLDAPLKNLLADKEQKFPFCVMWANENFTRRWDGLERDVLMTQEYREADDSALIACFAGLFADERYIRVEGRPLLMIYRVGLIPDAARRIAAWRNMFRETHREDPVIVMAQSIGDHDPTPYGLDGAVEFPPHKISDEVPRINGILDLFDPEFAASVYDYEAIASASLAAPAPAYPLIKTASPGWDNDPRREGKGLVLHDATPAKYQAWLQGLVKRAAAQKFFGEKIICINAWNEWAEGAFLEPDIHFGGAFLNATGRAVCGTAPDSKARLLLVGHDAQPHGAQMLLLNLARHYACVWGFEVHMLLLGAGPLVTDYQLAASVTLTSDKATIANAIARYEALGLRNAIVNSAAAARLAPQLAERGMAVTLLIHEMPRLLAEYNLQVQAKLGALAARRVVFSSVFAKHAFETSLGIALPRALVLPQGNYQGVGFAADARAEIRAKFGIADTAFLALGAGFGDLRKGFDIFVQVARKTLAARADVHFVWVGDIQPGLKSYLAPEMEAAAATGRFHHIGFTEGIAPYFSAADILLLPSREDPYPTVVLEALSAGAPVVAFDKSGGIPELLRKQKAGVVATANDTDDFRRKMLKLLNHSKLQAERSRLAALDFSQSAYAKNLILAARPGLKTVSVCVLNYNYARYLRPRLGAIFGQSYPVCEVVFFDDASGDDSVPRAHEIAEAAGREMSIIVNLKNAGSVFAQWRRAAERAAGDYVWIAEADDDCAPDFLSRVIEAMDAQEDAILGFCDSRMIDEAGRMISPGYQAHHMGQAGALNASGCWKAADFAKKFLSVQNLIFNVSGVLWRRDALLAALEACGDGLDGWRIAGDWRVYLEALTRGSGEVVYVDMPLNSHRRHGESQTRNVEAEMHLEEIRRMHEITAARLKLDAAARARQAAYLARVESQFLDEARPLPRIQKGHGGLLIN